MNDALRARLTGRAARFVHLLVDYGHLDEDAADALLVAVAAEGEGGGERAVDLPEVRRLAAMVLFDTRLAGDHAPDVLDDDWSLFFG